MKTIIVGKRAGDGERRVANTAKQADDYSGYFANGPISYERACELEGNDSPRISAWFFHFTELTQDERQACLASQQAELVRAKADHKQVLQYASEGYAKLKQDQARGEGMAGDYMVKNVYNNKKKESLKRVRLIENKINFINQNMNVTTAPSKASAKKLNPGTRVTLFDYGTSTPKVLDGVLKYNTGVVMDWREVKTDGRGIPSEFDGQFHDTSYLKSKGYVPLLLDSGEKVFAPKNYLEVGEPGTDAMQSWSPAHIPSKKAGGRPDSFLLSDMVKDWVEEYGNNPGDDAPNVHDYVAKNLGIPELSLPQQQEVMKAIADLRSQGVYTHQLEDFDGEQSHEAVKSLQEMSYQEVINEIGNKTFPAAGLIYSAFVFGIKEGKSVDDVQEELYTAGVDMRLVNSYAQRMKQGSQKVVVDQEIGVANWWDNLSTGDKATLKGELGLGTDLEQDDYHFSTYTPEDQAKIRGYWKQGSQHSAWNTKEQLNEALDKTFTGDVKLVWIPTLNKYTGKGKYDSDVLSQIMKKRYISEAQIDEFMSKLTQEFEGVGVEIDDTGKEASKGGGKVEHWNNSSGQKATIKKIQWQGMDNYRVDLPNGNFDVAANIETARQWLRVDGFTPCNDCADKSGKTAATNEDVIRMFLNDSFPKDKMPVWGTQNLKITKFDNGWGLVNYTTPLVYRSADNEVWFNNTKYSVTTTKIQNVIRSVASTLGIDLIEVPATGMPVTASKTAESNDYAQGKYEGSQSASWYIQTLAHLAINDMAMFIDKYGMTLSQLQHKARIYADDLAPDYAVKNLGEFIDGFVEGYTKTLATEKVNGESLASLILPNEQLLNVFNAPQVSDQKWVDNQQERKTDFGPDGRNSSVNKSAAYNVFYNSLDEVPGEKRWSGGHGLTEHDTDNPIPQIGDRVKVLINNLGYGTVEAYFEDDGWLGVKVVLENRPDWHKKNNPDRNFCTVFGAEIETVGTGGKQADLEDAEQLELFSPGEINEKATLGQVMDTFSSNWENWGDVDFIGYGGIMAKYSPSGKYFELYELVTPDSWDGGYAGAETIVDVRDIFENPDEDSLVENLTLTDSAQNVLTTSGIDNGQEMLKENPKGVIFSVVQGWMMYYGGESDYNFPEAGQSINWRDTNDEDKLAAEEATAQYLESKGMPVNEKTAAKPKKPTMTDTYLQEQFGYGGEVKNRGEIIRDLQDCGATPEQISAYMMGLERSKKSWKDKLQNTYESFDEFQAYDEVYGLAERLGFETAEQAWEANPMTQGSTNPEDFSVAKSGALDGFVPVEFQILDLNGNYTTAKSGKGNKLVLSMNAQGIPEFLEKLRGMGMRNIVATSWFNDNGAPSNKLNSLMYEGEFLTLKEALGCINTLGLDQMWDGIALANEIIAFRFKFTINGQAEWNVLDAYDFLAEEV